MAGAALAAVSAAAGFLVGRSLDDPPATEAPVPPRAPKSQSPRASLPAPRSDAPRAKPPAPAEELPLVEEPTPTGLRSEHDIERILRSHLKRDPPMERVREVIVLRQALFDAQRRVPQDWEDEALRRVIRSVKGEVPPLPKQIAADAAELLRIARDVREPFFFAVSDSARFAPLFEPASDGVRVDVTKPPAVVRADVPLVLLFPEGTHEWDGRVADRGRPTSDLVFQGAGMDTTLLRLRESPSRRDAAAVTLRDLTLLLDRTGFGWKGSQRLRLERCRVIGWEGRSDPLLEEFEGLFFASECRFEAGYAEKGTAALFDAHVRGVLARFERCRFRGPLESFEGNSVWSAKGGRSSTVLFESCTFLEMEHPTAKELEKPRTDGLRFVSCLADETAAPVGVRRSLADINPAWYVVR